MEINDNLVHNSMRTVARKEEEERREGGRHSATAPCSCSHTPKGDVYHLRSSLCDSSGLTAVGMKVPRPRGAYSMLAEGLGWEYGGEEERREQTRGGGGGLND